MTSIKRAKIKKESVFNLGDVLVRYAPYSSILHSEETVEFVISKIGRKYYHLTELNKDSTTTRQAYLCEYLGSVALRATDDSHNHVYYIDRNLWLKAKKAKFVSNEIKNILRKYLCFNEYDVVRDKEKLKLTLSHVLKTLETI